MKLDLKVKVISVRKCSAAAGGYELLLRENKSSLRFILSENLFEKKNRAGIMPDDMVVLSVDKEYVRPDICESISDFCGVSVTPINIVKMGINP